MRGAIAAVLAMIMNGCASWAPPQEDAIKAGDNRSCNPANLCVDLVVAVDTSASSARRTGEADSLGNMLFGYPEVGPTSRLWIALDGLSSALGELDPETVGVAVVGFAGEPDPKTNAGWVEAEVTNDFTAIEVATHRIRGRGAAGSSCHACAVRLAGLLLANAADAKRCPVLVILADTEATLPYGPAFMEENEREIARALRETAIGISALIAVGPADKEQAERLQKALAEAGGRMFSANDAGDVANAIVKAVKLCEG